MPVFAFGMPGPWEIALILVIVLILFGAGRLPQVFEQFGEGIKKFREASKEEAIDVSPKKAALTDEGKAEKAEESQPT